METDAADVVAARNSRNDYGRGSYSSWWLCGVLLPWLVVGMVAHVPAVMMCDMVSARYAALCARSGALT
ncbi:hypothetical protein H6S28_02565 [Escherichia coli]|nr:hypothetical protein H6S28_02565 [Escherichia coli]